MADRALVLDANILIRAVLGRSARQLIQRYAASIDFVAPDTVFLEAEEHIPALCAKLGLDLDAVRAVYTGVSNLVQELAGGGLPGTGSSSSSAHRAPGCSDRLCAAARMSDLDRG